MKACLLICCAILATLVPVTVQGQIPDSISYQGYLEEGGSPVDDPAAQLTFRLYEQEDGGDAVWTETHSGVPIRDGIFSVHLGSIQSLDTVAFNAAGWISVAIGDAAAPELAPRTALTAVPYALSLRGLRVIPSTRFEDGPSLLGGYWKNRITNGANSATIAGGGGWFYPNTVGARAGTVGGGAGNSAMGLYSTVSGGYVNYAPGGAATIPGGTGNNATGETSLAAGFYGQANHDGTFVWSDRSLTSTEPFLSTGENQFLIRAAGGVGINTNVLPLSPLTVEGIVESRVGGFKFPDGTIQSSAGVAAARSWVINGNAGTDSEDDFVGTTDNAPLVLRVDRDVALTLAPTSGTPAVIGGHESNRAGEGGAVGGGGSAASPNAVETPFSTVAGGLGNVAGLSSGPVGNNYYASVGGGHNNAASSNNTTVGGGRENLASGSESTVGGGDGNTASGPSSIVGGGADNTAASYGSVVAGGVAGRAAAQFASVGGGRANVASGAYAAVGGGVNNQATASYATIAGGGSETESYGNRATDTGGFVGGGYRNRAGNGNADTGDAAWATVSGGNANIAQSDHSFVGGGFANQANGPVATVAGGWSNHADGERSYIGGGRDNRAFGYASVVPGGFANHASGHYSFAAGWNARANNTGCFVWADAINTMLECNADHRWVARATGGVHFYTNASLTSGAFLASGGGSWNSVSDRKVKRDFQPVDSRQVLERLAKTDISTWRYVEQDPSIRHVGPTAQDFNKLVPGIGGEGDRYINSLDADGVALAAVKGLYELLMEQQTEIEALRAELERVRQ